jgi:hypothetical protein
MIDSFLGRIAFTFKTCTLLGLCSLLGCGGNSDLAAVTGKVTLDGKPVPNAFVKFLPKSAAGAPSFGKTDADGNYRMMFSDTEEGAWVGENSVTISTADTGLAPGMGTAEKIPAIYNTNTNLVQTVERGRNTFNFELESNAGKVVQPIDPDALPGKKR